MVLLARSRTLTAALLCLVAIAVTAAAAILSGSADAAVGAHRLGAVPTLPRGATWTGRLSGSRALSVDVALAPRDPAALSAYAAGITDPDSPDYHHALSTAQLRARFAPSAAQLARVERALTAAGLTPSRVSANGLLISVSAPAGTLSRAFHTRLVRVRLAGGHVAYTNTQAPEVPDTIANLIQGVVGLSDLSAPHALGLVREKGTGHAHADARRAEATAAATSAPTPCASASQTASADGAYTADEIASAYGFTSLYGAGDEGAGQTVGLMEFEEYATSDVAAFESCYGIDGGSASDVSTVKVDGGVNGDGQIYTGGADGSGEAALDIEQVVSLAPAADVAVYEAPDTESGELDAYTEMVDSSSVKVISTSWGECESLNGSGAATAENTIFEEAAAAGKSVFAAAGDAGSSDCFGEAPGRAAATPAVDDPGSQPYVTDVGGTSLPADTDPNAQTVWNDSSIDHGAGGGGISAEWTMPSYQRTAASALDVVSSQSSSSDCGASAGTYCREVPDVSADADPQTGYVVYYSGDLSGEQTSSWQAIAGTSAAAPLWAALTALANASTSCDGTDVGEANPVLYDIAANAGAYADAFTDITSGNNDYTPSGYSGGLYAAGTGYDEASGLGAPDAAALVPDMCAVARGAGVSGGSATSTPTTTTTATTTTSPASTPTATVPATSPTTTPASTATPTVTATGDGSTSAENCDVTATLRRSAYTLELSRARHSAELSLAMNLPAGCASYTLDLSRHIATTERGHAGAVDTLQIELLSSSGKRLATLGTLSNRNAAGGCESLALNLTRYAGQRLTVRFLARRAGSASTSFTLRSLALRLT